MGLQDFIITPFILLIIYAGAYLMMGRVTNAHTRPFFLPALTLKVIGAISVGLVYQFYYSGGDTFNYYFYGGTRYIWEAFLDNPVYAFKMIFGPNTYDADTFEYTRRIITYRDSSSYFVVRVTGIFSIITLNTYSGIAVCFAAASFSGLWAMYRGFYRLYPHLYKGFAYAIFFIPSVFFWGSGILKDTITLGAVGWMAWCFLNLIHRRKFLVSIIITLACMYVLYMVKIYILLSFLPAALFWIGYDNVRKIKNTLLKIVIAPVLISAMVGLGYLMVEQIGQGSKRYNIDAVFETAEITARYLYQKSVVEGGSAYTLGDFDYTPAGVVRKIPLAIWVSLYRPYIWESNNVVMLLSAMESLFFLLFTLYVLTKAGIGKFFRSFFKSPEVSFCLIFSVFFAFAVGFATYNFGSLVRYKIPLMPFYIIGFLLVLDYAKRSRKRGVLESTE